jgi:hypothetical protein
VPDAFVALIVTLPDAAFRLDPVNNPELDRDSPAADKTEEPLVTSHVAWLPDACICCENGVPGNIAKNVCVVTEGAITPDNFTGIV